ncbi:hypothetical protein CFC21_036893 [Triticum aestivum]|uniref:Glycosyltransferase n=2 Tax=Triticum aestivum TaxID=4565 RepID=A0A9R1F976_WHEAT|nr:hypothetical protein CFC21_036892 [Triticum aestivum]KAF7024559.1 hypothetical protein CFC21_036893 [Triticum aestivum]
MAAMAPTKNDDQPLHILFFPFLLPGHLIPMADMATVFAARGVRCTVLTTPVQGFTIRSVVDRANDSSATGTPMSISVVPFPDVGLPPAAQSGRDLATSGDYHDRFLQTAELLREPFRRFLSDHHADIDAVVSDSLFHWSAHAAAEHGLPRIAFLATSMFARACTDTLLRCNVFESCSDDPRAVVSLPGLPHRVEQRRSQMMDPTKRPHECAMFQLVHAADRSSYGELFNSFRELEPGYAEHYRATQLRRRAWLVGPVALASGSVEDMRELARGLDLSGKNFVWVIAKGSTAASSDPSTPEANRGYIIQGWAPQVLILNHPAIGGFVTHCGWNSTLEAVSAGVPMVTWPRYADQFYNEKLVVEVLGVGVGVGAEDYASCLETHRVIAGEAIAESIRRVMGEEGDGMAMRKKAKELGLMARGAVEKGGSSYDDVEQLMEELIARRSSVGCTADGQR